VSAVTSNSAQRKVSAEALSQARYAIYYAPEEGSPLDLFGQAWLGRDTRTGKRIRQPEVEGVFSQELQTIVSPAALYGFHGTLKPPFFLSDPEMKKTLIKDIKAFAAKEMPFYLPRLVVARIGRFLVLEPERSNNQINSLAERCVQHFDSYRQPLDSKELKTKYFLGLNSNQKQNFLNWGYPYVMDEFRFHLTLTGRIIDIHLSDHLIREIQKQLTGIDLNNIKVSSICLFIQPNKKQPFYLHSRYKFRATR
jgi:hypothetical protein